MWRFSASEMCRPLSVPWYKRTHKPAHSPSRTHGRRTIIDEDENPPTQERLSLLRRLQIALGDGPPNFWAACHFCELDALNLNMARTMATQAYPISYGSRVYAFIAISKSSSSSIISESLLSSSMIVVISLADTSQLKGPDSFEIHLFTGIKNIQKMIEIQSDRLQAWKSD